MGIVCEHLKEGNFCAVLNGGVDQETCNVCKKKGQEYLKNFLERMQGARPIQRIVNGKLTTVKMKEPELTDEYLSFNYNKAIKCNCNAGMMVFEESEYKRRRKICGECNGGRYCPYIVHPIDHKLANMAFQCPEDKFNASIEATPVEMATSFAGATIKHAMSGFEYRAQEDINRIQEICKACEHYLPDKKRCKLCGCWTQRKIRWASSHCKINKW